jgi:hypothetical protein
LLERIASQSGLNEDGDVLWNFLKFEAHSGPLTPQDKSYNGSQYNVLVRWEDGSAAYEPLHILAKDAPDMCAQYAKDNDLLDKDGWKQFRRRARNLKVLKRRVAQLVRAHNRWAPVYMYGIEIPRDTKHSRELDLKNGNTNWADSDYTEISQLMDYNFAKNVGPGDQKPLGHQKIRCRMIYAVKHDGRHKSRFVAGGHLTK